MTRLRVMQGILAGLVAAVVVLSLVVYSDTERLRSLAAAMTVRANKHAHTATSLSLDALRQLQVEAAAECYRVNYLRWQVDRAGYGAWFRDSHAATFLSHLRLQSREIRELSHAFRFAARSSDFLPLTDCEKADSVPQVYQPPVGIPFNRMPRAALFLALLRPPSLPVH